MDYNELTTKSVAELHELLRNKREEVRELRFKISENQHANVREIRKVKLEVAQIMTALNAKNK